jgi:hypothetical protein
MKRIVILALAGSVLVSGNAHAANLAVITSPPTILNLVIFLLACAGAVVGLQLLGVLKGGQLSKAWQIFVAGFAILALCQVSILLQTFEVLALPVWVSPALAVIWAGVFFYGVFETRRVLA